MNPVSRPPVPSEEDPPSVDPRVARSRAAIVGATVELLLEGGVHATTVDAIAERAGVSKATIYRHWESRQQLIVDALEELKPHHELPDTGSVRDDLVTLLLHLRDQLESPTVAAFASMLGAAAHDPELADLRQQYTAARRHPSEVVVERAQGRGELPADLDVDLFLSMVVGPLFYRKIVQGRSIPRPWCEQVVDAALRAYGSS